MNTNNNFVRLCGIRINNVSIGEVFTRVDEWIRIKQVSYIVTTNVDHLVRFQKDSTLRKVYEKASLAVVDGVPLLWAANILGTPLKEKISGSDLFPRLCEAAAQKGHRVFFLGGREGAAQKSADILMRRFPGLQIAGVYCPPFGFEADAEQNNKTIRLIADCRPDILFVGLGTPKQEYWIYRHQAECGVAVAVGIGASFDFISGIVRRAPVRIQTLGLEWLWRLCQEPRRLWKRYLWEGPVFFWLVLKQKLGSDFKPR